VRIDSLIWLPQVVDKLAWKHGVSPEEVEEVLFSKPVFRKIQKGHIPGEDLYASLGRTRAGRYLAVFFIYSAPTQVVEFSLKICYINNKVLEEKMLSCQV
jgi:uncharacterized DUF497 family protein